MLAKQTNYTNLRQNLASVLDEVIEDRGCVIVSRTGKEDVAILAASELASMMETLHLSFFQKKTHGYADGTGRMNFRGDLAHTAPHELWSGFKTK